MQNDAPTRSQKAPRYLWLLPLVMLLAAALACDDYYVPPPMIGRVEADADTAGRVYAEVVNIGLSYADSSNDKPGERATYLSDDYGLNWQAAEYVFAETAANSSSMDMSDEKLYLNGRVIWSFPRSIFRGIFYDRSNYPSEQRLELPYNSVSHSQQGDVLYVAMGTEGVLAFRASSDYRDWTLSANGIDSLSHLPLTITNSFDILGVVGLALLIPPFALIHAYLLSRVWVYLLPARAAWRAALKTTAGLVALAIVGIIFWLTNARTDLYEVIAVLTGITVIIGVSLTVYMAMQQQVSDYSRNRLAVGALLLSLVVPGGVAAIFAMWWLVFGLVFAYWAYYRVYHQFRVGGEPTPEGRAQRWQTDRLALETTGVVLVVLLAVIIVGYVGNIIFYMIGDSLSRFADIPLAVGVVVSIYVVYKAMQFYGRRRAMWIIKPKSDFNTPSDAETESNVLVRWLTVHSVLWVVLALIASGATFMGQAWAYGWFTSLLKGP